MSNANAHERYVFGPPARAHISQFWLTSASAPFRVTRVRGQAKTGRPVLVSETRSKISCIADGRVLNFQPVSNMRITTSHVFIPTRASNGTDYSVAVRLDPNPPIWRASRIQEFLDSTDPGSLGQRRFDRINYHATKISRAISNNES